VRNLGHFNWKILSDNFNECYHCPTTHPDIPSFLNLETFDSTLKDGHIQHHCKPTQEQEDAGVVTHSTYFFPNSSMSVSKHFIMIQHFLPTSPISSTMSYQIFRNITPSSSDADFHAIADMYERVMREDKVLCIAAQKNLETGVFVSGMLHPKFEKAPVFFQKSVRECVVEWAEREKRVGREIWSVERDGGGERGDEEFCEGLGCGDGGKKLDW
jgi:phenylpropionate dioxygenase-like ring-hydroxylating dioxygenase large terminal subunit